MGATAGRDLVDNTENSAAVGNQIPCLSYSSAGVVAILTTRSRGFTDYRRKLDAYADVSTKRVNLFNLALWRF